jgi:hypothetical protein
MLDHRIRTRERFTTRQIQHRIDWLDLLLEAFPCVVNDATGFNGMTRSVGAVITFSLHI